MIQLLMVIYLCLNNQNNLVILNDRVWLLKMYVGVTKSPIWIVESVACDQIKITPVPLQMDWQTR